MKYGLFRANRLKLCGNCAFPKNFHTRKLGEITIFYAVWITSCVTKFPFCRDIGSSHWQHYHMLAKAAQAFCKILHWKPRELFVFKTRFASHNKFTFWPICSKKYWILTQFFGTLQHSSVIWRICCCSEKSSTHQYTSDNWQSICWPEFLFNFVGSLFNI